MHTDMHKWDELILRYLMQSDINMMPYAIHNTQEMEYFYSTHYIMQYLKIQPIHFQL